jgi:hypothetical protein
MVIIEKLKAIADAIRVRTGGTEPLTLDEMVEAIESMEVSDDVINTYILVDENGNEVPAVLVDEPVTLTANATTDIRKGMTAVTDEGLVTGEKEIPGYITTQGKIGVKPTKPLRIRLFSDICQYTKLMVTVCDYNTSLNDSVSATLVVLGDYLYNVGSSTPIANVTVDAENHSIDLGLINDRDSTIVVHYMTIKEEY